jgi:selenocysteine-specific elongation factor
LQNPISALYGDRFIIRRQTPLATVGGGMILDHLPFKRTKKGDAKALDHLKRLEVAIPQERLQLILEQRAMQGASEAYLKSRIGLTPEKIRELQSDQIMLLRKSPVLMISANAGKTILERIHSALKTFHEKNPLLPGIPKEELRSRFLSKIPADVYQAILDHALSSQSIQLQKDAIALAGKTPSLNIEDETMAEAVIENIKKAGLEFQGLADLSSNLKKKIENVTKITYLLVRQGKVIKVTDDYFVHREKWDELKSKIRELKASQKTFSVAEFKERFGVSRKYAIPLLELLDREGVTRRIGNERIII